MHDIFFNCFKHFWFPLPVRFLLTLGARDFSSAVSGFYQVFAAREFGLRPKICRPSANTENSRCTREKPLVPRVLFASKKSKNIYCGKNAAIFRWPSPRMIALQVVRTSFLGPRPRLSPPPPLISPIVGNKCENLHYESVYFKELHNEQKYYWPTIYRAGAAVVSTITSVPQKYNLESPRVSDWDSGIREIQESSNVYLSIYF